MKIFLSVIFVGVCFMVGKAAASEKKLALERLCAVSSLLSHIQRRVETSNLMLLQAISEYKSDVLENAGFFASFASNGRISVSRSWQNGVMKLRLDNDSRDILLTLGESLGLLDREKQLEAIGYAMKRLDGRIDAQKEEYDRKARCYGVLGGLFGALAVIVII